MIHYLQLLNTQQDKDKFVILYQRYFQPLYSTAFEILKDHAASEDVVHETFLILIDHIDKVDEQASMKTWNYLATIVRRLCIDSLRKQKKTILRDMESESAWAVSNDDIESDFIGKEMTEQVKNLIQQLDHKRKNHPSPWSYRRYIAIVALLMLGVSGAALASDDIREGLRRLSLQFFSDNVTIESAPESTTEQEGPDTASEEFHAYKWKEIT